ncbi:MAG: T9SS type A sorting domain-containing protein [Cyclobacteriaceae bacterium]|nr:T9SS type A sorting domain-containing protein [Cyclobacteriaceae bacterium]
MKKSVVFALLMAFVSVAALAADPVGPKMVVVNQKDPGTFKVIYEGSQAGKITLRIINSEGRKVVSETISNVEGFMRTLNFAGMTAGEYTIEVVSAGGTRSQKINYQPASDESAIHVAKLAAENKYLLAVANTKAVNVKIYDGTNTLVHDQDVAVNGSIGLVYDLNKIIGSPRFEVSSASATKVVRY